MLWRIVADGQGSTDKCFEEVPVKKILVAINGEVLQQEWV